MAKKRSKRCCKWKYEDTHDMYETNCGHTFGFIEGGWKDNGMVYCPYCGKPIDKRTR